MSLSRRLWYTVIKRSFIGLFRWLKSISFGDVHIINDPKFKKWRDIELNKGNKISYIVSIDT